MRKSRIVLAVGIILTSLAFVQCKSRDDSSQVADANANANSPALMNAAGVWDQIAAAPYRNFPRNTVTLSSFASRQIPGLMSRLESLLGNGRVGSYLASNIQGIYRRLGYSPDILAARAATTIGDERSIVPHFDKLVHANGVCIKGRWKIDEETNYSGHFKAGTDAPFIGRVSVAFGDINRGDYRAYGIAGKIFNSAPVESGASNNRTANFFTIDDLAGTKADRFADLVFSNEPALTKQNFLMQGPRIMAIGAATALAFAIADKNPGKRQVYEISELGATRPIVVTPKWMHLQLITPMRRLSGGDFRDEWNMNNFDTPPKIEIRTSSVAQSRTARIGNIEIEEMVASSVCDHQLHFHHPKWKDRLNY